MSVTWTSIEPHVPRDEMLLVKMNLISGTEVIGFTAESNNTIVSGTSSTGLRFNIPTDEIQVLLIGERQLDPLKTVFGLLGLVVVLSILMVASIAPPLMVRGGRSRR
jgi:hypothetical protein